MLSTEVLVFLRCLAEKVLKISFSTACMMSSSDQSAYRIFLVLEINESRVERD